MQCFRFHYDTWHCSDSIMMNAILQILLWYMALFRFYYDKLHCSDSIMIHGIVQIPLWLMQCFRFYYDTWHCSDSIMMDAILKILSLFVHIIYKICRARWQVPLSTLIFYSFTQWATVKMIFVTKKHINALFSKNQTLNNNFSFMQLWHPKTQRE